MTCHVTLMSRTSSTSLIQRELIQANGHRGSNQKSALVEVMHSFNSSGHSAFPNVRTRSAFVRCLPGQ